MESNILDEVRDIKKSLRLSMNGVVSTLQRRQGLDYKINFGVEIPRLRGIANAYEKSKELATTLWQDNIRECKMLAIFLMPESGYSDVADQWIEETKFTEIADQLAMHLLCKLPCAWEKAVQWIKKNEGLFGYCGFLTISHLVRRGMAPSSEQEESFFDCAISFSGQEQQNITAKCALNAISNYLDHFPNAVATLKEAINSKNSKPASLVALLESIE